MSLYEPQEDSMLLVRNIDFSNKKVLDMGTGSGILAQKALNMKNNVLAVDINPEAVENARKMGIKSKISNLFENIDEKFDVIMFNAPYLPSEDEDIIWDGGKNGREIIERFAEKFKNHLTDTGYVLMVISSLTGLDETLKLFSDYNTKIIDKEKIPWEELYLIRIE